MKNTENATASEGSLGCRVGPHRTHFKEQSLIKRCESAPLWEELSKQDERALPFMLERYLLLENWSLTRRGEKPCEQWDVAEEIAYLHHLLATATTVLLSQEERIRKLETAQRANITARRQENNL